MITRYDNLVHFTDTSIQNFVNGLVEARGSGPDTLKDFPTNGIQSIKIWKLWAKSV